MRIYLEIIIFPGFIQFSKIHEVRGWGGGGDLFSVYNRNFIRLFFLTVFKQQTREGICTIFFLIRKIHLTIIFLMKRFIFTKYAY